jgi:hypothetical protein
MQHISEIAIGSPRLLTDHFGFYVCDENPKIDSVYCFPRYVANKYGFNFSHIPPLKDSLFNINRKMKNHYLLFRTFDDVKGVKFSYPFTPHFVDDLAKVFMSGRESDILDQFKQEKTFIYLIKDEDTGFIKIGRSIDPENRLRTLIKQDTLMPRPNNFRLMNCWEDSSMTEIALHNEFKAKRVRGEWFNLSTGDLLDIYEFFRHRPIEQSFNK